MPRPAAVEALNSAQGSAPVRSWPAGAGVELDGGTGAEEALDGAAELETAAVVGNALGTGADAVTLPEQEAHSSTQLNTPSGTADDQPQRT